MYIYYFIERKISELLATFLLRKWFKLVHLTVYPPSVRMHSKKKLFHILRIHYFCIIKETLFRRTITLHRCQLFRGNLLGNSVSGNFSKTSKSFVSPKKRENLLAMFHTNRIYFEINKRKKIRNNQNRRVGSVFKSIPWERVNKTFRNCEGNA